jgi:hypothetical protein
MMKSSLSCRLKGHRSLIVWVISAAIVIAAGAVALAQALPSTPRQRSTVQVMPSDSFPPKGTPPPPTPDTSPPVGIIDHPSVPFPPSSVTITNAWQGYVNGDFVQVYAGSDYGNTTDTSQGWLIVVTHSTSDSISGQTYNTPGQDGPVTITAADGSNLSLTATDGTVFVFDVQTDTYDMGSPSPSPSESPTGV